MQMLRTLASMPFINTLEFAVIRGSGAVWAWTPPSGQPSARRRHWPCQLAIPLCEEACPAGAVLRGLP